MTKVINQQYKLQQEIFFREEPNVEIWRAKSIIDGKQYVIKFWKIYRNGMNGNNYKAKFERENTILREASEELKIYLPRLVECGLQALVSEDDNQLISYQVFEDIKYNNIMCYHHKNRMIPEAVGIHLFKSITKAVKVLNLLGKTFYTLNPTYIMIDESLNPIFMDLSNVRDLNYAQSIEQIDEFQLTRNFRPPQVFKKKGTFNIMKMDSYQLGVVAISLMLTGYPPFDTATEKDSRYKMIMLGQYQTFFKSLQTKRVAGELLEELIGSLITSTPEKRIDPKDIEHSKWWKEENTKMESNELDLYVKDIMEKKLKQEAILKNKEKPIFQQQTKAIAFNPFSANRFFDRSPAQHYSHLKPTPFQGCITPNTHYWDSPIHDTFFTLRKRSQQKFNSIQQSSSKFVFVARSIEDSLGIQVSVYPHPTINQTSIVSYKLLNSDAFYFDEMFQRAIEYFQAQNHCQ